MGCVVRSLVAALILFFATSPRVHADNRPLRTDALDILRAADVHRQSILNSIYVSREVLLVVDRDRAQQNLPELNRAQRTEIEIIVSQLNEGRKNAYRILDEGEANIRKAIELAAREAATRAEFERKRKREKLYLDLFQGVLSVAQSAKSIYLQRRIHQLRGAPKDARKDMHAAYSGRGIASTDDFVSKDSGLPVEEIFNPLRGEPDDLDFFDALPSTYENCLTGSIEWFDNQFPTWEGRLAQASGLDSGLDGAQLGTQIGIHWDCGVKGLPKSRYVP